MRVGPWRHFQCGSVSCRQAWGRKTWEWLRATPRERRQPETHLGAEGMRGVSSRSLWTLDPHLLLHPSVRYTELIGVPILQKRKQKLQESKQFTHILKVATDASKSQTGLPVPCPANTLSSTP